jgi:hypothetical protein
MIIEVVIGYRRPQCTAFKLVKLSVRKTHSSVLRLKLNILPGLSSQLPQHRITQDRIDARLVALAIGLEPHQYVGIDPHGGGLFGGFVQGVAPSSGISDLSIFSSGRAASAANSAFCLAVRVGGLARSS